MLPVNKFIPARKFASLMCPADAYNWLTSTTAPAPNITPAGFTMYTRPFDHNVPSISDGSAP